MSLKPLTDYEKSLLGALDEDPNEHQQRLAKRMRGEKVSSPPADPLLKKLQEGKVTIGPTIAEAAAALELRVALWREDAYCIFIAHSTCKGCGKKTILQRDPQIYLRSRMTRSPGDKAKEYYGTRTHQYIPVREVTNWSLPRLRVSSFHNPFTCEDCFEGLQPCQAPPSPPPFQADIGLPEVQPSGWVESLQSPALTPPVLTSVEDIETSIPSSVNLLSGEEERKLNYETSLLLESPSEHPLVIAGDLTFPTAEMVFAKSMSLNEG